MMEDDFKRAGKVRGVVEHRQTGRMFVRVGLRPPDSRIFQGENLCRGGTPISPLLAG